ncbi:4Fe-4S binding protein [Anaerosoma tenue]|jgi:pyruvate ferredoxin oxidoreductase delta subunit|uniref:4Fe-4S binding protein n=1 Tax=Anaerosoma tenue TaxID=2933588 RepID=UPI002260FA65|nr:4Fe-4S binding protein [Anaerosoma tenue]MCK8115833.1 4Fe-4S binding protein [Anaerosoma tenue]
MKWDISEMGSWTYGQFPPGAIIPEAGNSNDYITGGWRSERPWRDDATCTQCLLCWIVCPDSSINVADEKVTSFDLDHCKGCGICAQVCPVDAIEMVPEGCELPGVK